MTKDNGDPPEDAREKESVEGVSQWRLASRHKKVTRQMAGSEGLTVGTRLARKVQRLTPDASQYLKALRLPPGGLLFAWTGAPRTREPGGLAVQVYQRSRNPVLPALGCLDKWPWSKNLPGLAVVVNE